MKLASELSGSTVYVRPSYVNSVGDAFLEALVMHELLHNITIFTDPDLEGFFPSGGSGSNDITLGLLADCLP